MTSFFYKIVALGLCCTFSFPLSLSAEESNTVVEKSGALEDISFTAAYDGSIEKYILILPQDYQESELHTLMIALHGHGSDRWQFATGDIAVAKAARDAATKHNMIYVSPDYRATTSWMGPAAEADILQIIGVLKRQYSIDKVILVGASMGGSSTMTFTALHPELIDGAVAINGTANHLEYKNYQQAIHASFGGTQSTIPTEYKRRSAEYWPEAFTMPIAFTTGGKDTAVPPDSCQRLSDTLKLFNPHVLHIHQPEGGHSTNYTDAETAYAFVIEKVLSTETIETAPVEITAIGSRRELFMDDTLIESMTGHTQQRLHHPVPQEVVLHHDAPWEGTGSGYHSIFKDGDLYKMYYKAWHIDVSGGTLNTSRHPLYCCYAESDDGITWHKPNLGLHEFEGSNENNITITSGERGPLHIDAGHPAIFKDANPDAPSDAQYKAIVRSSKPNGLLLLKSPDGLTWTPMTDVPILNGLGAFDSQNLAFWDPTIKKYRAYWRIFTEGITSDDEWKPAGYRAIRTAVSDDMINWGPHTDLSYEDSPNDELYTNQIKPYHRAPHLLIGFPTRYIERGWSDSMRSLPNVEGRKDRSVASERYGTALTETLVMVSRDGTHFKRWNEAFLSPGIERPGTWHYGQQYMAWHVVETASALAGAPNELSLYAVEQYWHGAGSALRRFTLRLDGFVSLYAPMEGGEVLTKPITFEGNALHINFASSAAGDIQVELQDQYGKPIPGYSLEDSVVVFGDAVDRQVSWKGGGDLSAITGKTIRIRFVLKDAHL